MKAVITTHKNMDLDALGAVVAVRKLYPDATVVLPGTKGKDVVKVLEENPHLLNFINESEFGEKIEKLIVVDTPDISRIPKGIERNISENTEIIIYDHHSKKPDGFKNFNMFFKETGAVTSLLAMILKGRKIVPSPLEASIMALGIYSDTGSFLFPGTTALDHIAAAYLFSVDANPDLIKYYLPTELSAQELDILKLMKDNLEIIETNGNTVGLITVQFDRYVGDIAHLVSKMIEITNLPAIVTIAGVESTVFVICRSRSPLIDVSKVAESFGGGGHQEAASAVVRDKTVHEVKEEVLKTLKKVVTPAKVAKDIMSSPAQTIEASETVKNTLSILMKQGINAAPIVDENGKIIGIVNRNLIDKAFYMKMEDESVEIIMEREMETVSPETPVQDVENIIISTQQTLVPVVKNKKVTGVITRTDILTNTYKEEIQESKKFYEKLATSQPKIKNIKKILKERIPGKIYKLLLQIGELADREELNAYIIGGFVRDLIIGRKNLDIDIVVEGDATKLAKKFAEEVKGKLHVFNKYKTATVVLPDNFTIDFASTRTEVYHSPGALPVVDSAPLKKDLFRRDFTINTLAVKINKNEFGKLIDFFNGLKDIKDKKIRVLHALSFVEDPTRILRALRFAVRYRFEIGKHTEKLLKIAVDKNIFRTVEGRRIYLELKHIFEEDNPLRIINKMKEYEILKNFSNKLIWNKKKKDFFERIRKVINWHKLTFGTEKKSDYPLLYFAALLENTPKDELNRILDNLFSVPEKEKKLIKELIYKGKNLTSWLERKKPKNSDIHTSLKNEKEEMILYAAAKTDNEKLKLKILDFLSLWKDMQLTITGEDLKKLGIKPGPKYKEIFEKLKKEVIDNKIDNQYDELIEEVKKLMKPTTTK